MPEKDQLAAIRHWLLEHHAEFRRLLQRPGVRKAFSEFEGNALTRPPKGFPCEHPAMDLIRCRQWGLSTSLPAKAALKAAILAYNAVINACPASFWNNPPASIQAIKAALLDLRAGM